MTGRKKNNRKNISTWMSIRRKNNSVVYGRYEENKRDDRGRKIKKKNRYISMKNYIKKI